MRCRENFPNVMLDVPHLLFHAEWCDLTWGSGHTYCFRSPQGYDSQVIWLRWLSWEMASARAERGNAMSQLKIWDKIASQKLVRIRNNIFQGVQAQPRHLVTKAWQAAWHVSGIPAIHTTELERLLAPSSGLLCMVIVRCPYNVWHHYGDSKVTHLTKEEQKGLSSALVHWHGHR